MYPTFDVQTTLTFARQHQDDVRAAFPRRGRVTTWLRRRRDERSMATLRPLTPPAQEPTQHRAAA
jgi:hypothetical protein